MTDLSGQARGYDDKYEVPRYSRTHIGSVMVNGYISKYLGKRIVVVVSIVEVYMYLTKCFAVIKLRN